MTELLDRLLAMPVGPSRPARSDSPDFTRRVEVSGDKAEVEVRTEVGGATEGLASEVLRSKGENPDEWEVIGLRSSEWTMANGSLGESTRFSFRRKAFLAPDLPIDDLLKVIEQTPLVAPGPTGAHGIVIALGDMQFGKIDGDGAEGTLSRTISCINRAAELVGVYGERYDIGHVHIAWLGDHVEGFQSQGGANVWRTGLTLSEQIRLTRRVMLHAMLRFAGAAERVSMAAVPGNHGETARFAGKGVTRYDDSHDTESLIAVSDAAALNPERFGHVEFYVPDNDEMTVLVGVAGTQVAHVHGHQFRPGKHFEWWKGQTFGGGMIADADVLLAGHLHHEHVDTDGPRLFLQVPAMESESTWWRHSKGTMGHPGLIFGVTKDGQMDVREVVRA